MKNKQKGGFSELINNEMVKMARLNLRMTQAEFGELLGVSASTIQHVESGRRKVSDTLRARLVQEIDFDELKLFFERYSELDNIIPL